MTVIGVAGGTGCGKSTLCAALNARLPGSAVIDGDALLNDTLRFYADDFFRMFGERIQSDAQGRFKIRFFLQNPAMRRAAITIARGYLSGSSPRPPIFEDGADAATTAILAEGVALARAKMSEGLGARLEALREGGAPAVIVDWANLPALDAWKACDVKVIVTASDETRLERLMARKKSRRFTEDELRAMIKNADLPYDDIPCDLRIVNERAEDLRAAAEAIAGSFPCK